MGLLNETTAVITGAGRGIGRAIALRFASEGAGVVCTSRTEANAQSVAGEIKKAGHPAWAVAVDVADADSVKEAAARILKEPGRVDVLVNNAGITRDNLLMRLSEADWDAVLDTNLRGAFLMTKAFARAFVKQRRGRIINVSSVSGLLGNAGQANYAASKAGLIALTKTTARELASRGVTANAICPGFIETDMTDRLTDEVKQEVVKQIPLGAFGRPEDIAEAALFLAGDSARYITGQTLTVDGGMAM